ncbi:unnamed protein product [Urochloa humidicola]
MEAATCGCGLLERAGLEEMTLQASVRKKQADDAGTRPIPEPRQRRPRSGMSRADPVATATSRPLGLRKGRCPERHAPRTSSAAVTRRPGRRAAPPPSRLRTPCARPRAGPAPDLYRRIRGLVPGYWF